MPAKWGKGGAGTSHAAMPRSWPAQRIERLRFSCAIRVAANRNTTDREHQRNRLLAIAMNGT